MLIITSRVNGFRRCGVAHSSIPTEHSDERFTEEEQTLLRAEPMLTVEVITDDPGSSSPSKTKKE
jgi:hypothetical protein